jgi:hypothetical protein
VVRAFNAEVAPAPWPAVDAPAEIVRPWVLPAVYAREQSGQGAFLTEFRPVVALFLRFGGIDYEAERAGAQLDAFVRRAQQVLAQRGGTLLELNIGDKGSYVYAVFGAPAAHEDDARRAVAAALALRAAARELGYLTPVQIGIGRARAVPWRHDAPGARRDRRRRQRGGAPDGCRGAGRDSSARACNTRSRRTTCSPRSCRWW